MAAPLYTTASGLLWHAGKILILTVGLPARGKTHISRALERYLRWTGVKTQVVSLSDYRRKTLGGAQSLPPDYFSVGEKSPETLALRKRVSDDCEKFIWDFFADGGQVVIYDANNGTRAPRQFLAEKFDKEGIHVILLESICDDKEIIERNIRGVKISSPDYRGWDPDKAVADYYDRIRDREKTYETITETNWPFIRIFNVGEKIMVNNIRGYLQSRIVFFLMNIHNRFRMIYFARSGQSLIEHSYKADSDLSPAGWEYAEKLREFVTERRAKALEQRGYDPEDRRLKIWTSTRRRAHHTAWPFLTAQSSSSVLSAGSTPPPVESDSTPTSKEGSPKLRVKVIEKPQMSEINPGVWDGLTPDQAKRFYPGEWARFVKDPYAFRAPRAESYHDLSVRLEQVLIELEREKEDLLIIGHSSVIRCLLAYLIGLPASEIPAIEIARGDLLEVVPTSYGVHSQAFHFWDGPGRLVATSDGEDSYLSHRDETNFYENWAEDTKGKKRMTTLDIASLSNGGDYLESLNYLMVWYCPPSRRETSLVLFSLATFVIFYNLEASFVAHGPNQTAHPASKTQSVDWDKLIYGNWTREEAQVAENAHKETHNDTYITVSFQPQIFGSVSVNDEILDWGKEVPTTTLIKHVPGHTIMDNVFMLNGTLFIVTDDPSFPPLGVIASSSKDSHAAPLSSDWQILSSAQARETLGSFGGLIHGVSWLVTDAAPSNYTLFSLWRTYSALDTSLAVDALTLPPPRRVFYPHVPTFMGKQPDPNGPIILRHRSPSGFHPFLVKAAFPTLALMYEEDWADYALLHVPFLMKRVVVSDQGAARRARTDLPPFAAALLELEAAKEWWEPIRRHVARFLNVAEEAPKRGWFSKTRTVITYLSSQDAAHGPKLRNADHEALVKALGRLGREYRVHIVSTEGSWSERMRAITQSTVVLGVYGNHMADCVYMPPSSRATVMEMFPPGVFVRDLEVSVRALNMRYFAWWEARQHGVDELPLVVPSSEKDGSEVPIDVQAMVNAIRRIA